MSMPSPRAPVAPTLDPDEVQVGTANGPANGPFRQHRPPTPRRPSPWMILGYVDDGEA